MIRVNTVQLSSAVLDNSKLQLKHRFIACERRRIFSVTGSAENNVCESELENNFCDVGILSQSQFSSGKPRTTARGIRASQETMADNVDAAFGKVLMRE